MIRVLRFVVCLTALAGLASVASSFEITGVIGTGSGVRYGGPTVGITGGVIGTGIQIGTCGTGVVDLSAGCTITVAAGLGP